MKSTQKKGKTVPDQIGAQRKRKRSSLTRPKFLETRSLSRPTMEGGVLYKADPRLRRYHRGTAGKKRSPEKKEKRIQVTPHQEFLTQASPNRSGKERNGHGSKVGGGKKPGC